MFIVSKNIFHSKNYRPILAMIICVPQMPMCVADLGWLKIKKQKFRKHIQYFVKRATPNNIRKKRPTRRISEVDDPKKHAHIAFE